MVLLIASLLVMVLNLAALAATHVGPWAGVGVLAFFAATPFVPVRLVRATVCACTCMHCLNMLHDDCPFEHRR